MILPLDFKKRGKHIYKETLKRIKEEGFQYLLLLTLIGANYVLRLVKPKTFLFENVKYSYFYHPYNHTWVNERTVEVPIVLSSLRTTKGKVLEIGNVLRHYFSNMKHDVIDKGEKYQGVINQDVVDFKSKKKYDTIVSISTMEHVGWDEEIKDSAKITRAIKNLKKYLNKGGRIIITVPLNYNPYIENLIAEKKLFNKSFFMRRKLLNRWQQTSWEKARKLHYKKNITARALAILIVEKK